MVHGFLFMIAAPAQMRSEPFTKPPARQQEVNCSNLRLAKRAKNVDGLQTATAGDI